MDFRTFQSEIKQKAPPGTVFKNLGRGTSTIVSYSNVGVSYMRRQSIIYVQFADLYGAYQKFKGTRVNSTDLKALAPSVFDSKADAPGHSCNCTFLFLLLQRLGIIQNIYGRGVRGDPYSADILA